MAINKVKEVTFKPGDYILREGATCDALFVIKSGQIEIFRLDRNKKKIPLAIARSGEYLGEMSLVTDSPHRANAVALVETVCIKIDNLALENQLKNAPAWLVSLTRGLVVRLAKTNDVLKRNGLVDETLYSAVKAIESQKKAS